MAAITVLLFFLAGQKVEQQRADFSFAQRARHELISRTVPAASTAMGEKHNAGGISRHHQFATQP